MAPTRLERCARGHSELLRTVRANGRRSVCSACARLHRTFAGVIPDAPEDWPELLRPGNESVYLRWCRLPRNARLGLGGVDHARIDRVTPSLARWGV